MRLREVSVRAVQPSEPLHPMMGTHGSMHNDTGGGPAGSGGTAATERGQSSAGSPLGEPRDALPHWLP